MATSIIDFLDQQGKDSSFATRAKLASTAGITNYIGSADQNTKLLKTLSSGVPSQPSGRKLTMAEANDPNNPHWKNFTPYSPTNQSVMPYGPQDNQSRLPQNQTNMSVNPRTVFSGPMSPAPNQSINPLQPSGGVSGGGGGDSWGGGSSPVTNMSVNPAPRALNLSGPMSVNPGGDPYNMSVNKPTTPNAQDIAKQIIEDHRDSGGKSSISSFSSSSSSSSSAPTSEPIVPTQPTVPTPTPTPDAGQDLLKQRYALMNALFNDATDISAADVGILTPDQYTALKNKDKNGIEEQLSLLNSSLTWQAQQRKEAASNAREDAKANAPREVGGNLVQLNPDTGKYEVVYQGPASGGNTPTSYDEWQLAGQPGTYADFIQGKKGLNGIQTASIGFADRMHSSNDIINQIGQQFTNNSSIIGGWLPNMLQGSDRQLFEQAKRDFITAKLRQESGAAISDSEFERADKQYFPQAGDSPEVVAQKKANREMVISGMETQAGPTYKDHSSYVNPNGDTSSGDELDQALSGVGFSKVGGDTKKIATAIGQFESGGNYKAIGPKTSSGDKAYGKYQVMGNNIPSWTKEATGKSYTIAEFYNSPEIQDKVAYYKMGKLYKQYGNIGDVASVWFSGRPIKKAGNAKDVIGTSVPQYVRNVQSIYNSLG